MVYIYFGLTVIILLQIKLGYAVSCGSLELKKTTVSEGEVATLIFKPNRTSEYRKWFVWRTRWKPIYGSGKANNDNKYVEATQGYTFTLSIRNVDQTDTGMYAASCGEEKSEVVYLTVIPSDTERQLNCGKLTVKENNLTEGQTTKLLFSIHPGRQIKWEKKINSTFQQLFRGPDYHLIRTVEKTTHNLVIYLSEYSDSGEYRVNCDTVVSNSVHLYIVPTAPTVPEFSGNESKPECKECILAELNVSVQVECFVKGGTKPVVLTMFKDGGNISNVNRYTTTKDGVNVFYAKHHFVPSAMDFDVGFTCTVQNPALTVELNKSAQLYIRVDPKLIELKMVSYTKENEPSEIQCTTMRGRPPKKSLIFIGGSSANKTDITDEIPTGHTYTVTTRTVTTFTRSDNQIQVVCCSTMLNRICSNITTVNVLFPPRSVKVTEVNKMNTPNGEMTLTLECSVDESNPKSSIVWKGLKYISRTKVKEIYRLQTTGGWTLSEIWMLNLTRQHNGHNITCEVKSQAFPDLELMQIYRPNITYKTVITISGQGNGVVYIGDEILLTCNVDSNPPSTLAWHNQADLIKETYGTKSLKLHIANISLSHSRMYTCTAYNNIDGTRTKSVFLTVKEKIVPKPLTESSSSPVVVPVVVACTVVAVAATVVVTVFFTCMKRRQNTQVELKEIVRRQEERKTSLDSGKNGTNCADDEADEERLYETIDSVEEEIINDLEETKVYPDLDYDDVVVDSVPSTKDIEETHSYSKLDGDDQKTNLQSDKDKDFNLAEIDMKPDFDNGVSKQPLLVQDETKKESHYVDAEKTEYEGLGQNLDTKETNYSKLD